MGQTVQQGGHVGGLLLLLMLFGSGLGNAVVIVVAGSVGEFVNLAEHQTVQVQIVRIVVAAVAAVAAAVVLVVIHGLLQPAAIHKLQLMMMVRRRREQP